MKLASALFGVCLALLASMPATAQTNRPYWVTGFENFTAALQYHEARSNGLVTLETVESTIDLDPDVRSYFLGSGAVNRVLRGLIELIPEKQGKRQ